MSSPKIKHPRKSLRLIPDKNECSNREQIKENTGFAETEKSLLAATSQSRVPPISCRGRGFPSRTYRGRRQNQLYFLSKKNWNEKRRNWMEFQKLSLLLLVDEWSHSRKLFQIILLV